MFVPAPPPDARAPSAPLIVTADAAVVSELVRLAAAAGVQPTLAADVTAARPMWAAAPLVLVGADISAELIRAALPRRPGVVLVEPGATDVRSYQQAVALGADDVVALPDAESPLVQRIADAVEGDTRAATVLGVIGGRGGAGATTLAVALALSGKRFGARTMLIDADPLGGGVDLAVGAEHVHGLRWDDLAATSGRISAAALHDALVHAHDLTVLSCGRQEAPELPVAAMQSALQAGCRSHDLLVVDMPRHLDAAARLAAERLDTLLVVVPAEVRAAAAASRVVARASMVVNDIRVVVRGPAPSSLRPGTIADSLGLPLVGELRPERRLDAALDRGDPPGERRRGPLATFAARFLAEFVPVLQAKAGRGTAA